MAALTQALILIVGICSRCVSQGTQASDDFNVKLKIRSLQGKKCVALHWNGVCDKITDCKTKAKITLLKGSTSAINYVPLFQPYNYGIFNKSQAVCFYDGFAGETVSCCNDIIPGLSTGNILSFSDYEKVTFRISTCHRNDNYTQCPFVESTFVLPWMDACLVHKPCGDEGSCDNHMKPGYSNCSCYTQWKGDNCTIPKDFTLHTRKCLKDVKGAEKLVNKTMKECVKRCLELGNTKCKSFEFKSSAKRNGSCVIKDSNTLNDKLVDCTSDYFQKTALLEISSGQGSSFTIICATWYILLGLFSCCFLNA